MKSIENGKLRWGKKEVKKSFFSLRQAKTKVSENIKQNNGTKQTKWPRPAILFLATNLSLN